MLSKNVESALNAQIKKEGDSSQIYLAMASWAEIQGYEGISKFLFDQSDEERMHMLKLIKYVNQRGGKAVIPNVEQPEIDLTNHKSVFTQLLKHEISISESINELVGITMDERDFSTQNFLQWYVAEQIEEEANAQYILDKINLIGEDKGGLYLFDNEMKNFRSPVQTEQNAV